MFLKPQQRLLLLLSIVEIVKKLAKPILRNASPSGLVSDTPYRSKPTKAPECILCYVIT
jgi:hypothetical protein